MESVAKVLDRLKEIHETMPATATEQAIIKEVLSLSAVVFQLVHEVEQLKTSLQQRHEFDRGQY